MAENSTAAGTAARKSDAARSHNYRVYDEALVRTDKVIARNYYCYLYMHTFQTVDFATARRAEFLQFTHGRMTLLEALDALNDFVDESDPDVDFPNALHGYQTAESLRQAHPDKDWLHLVGLVHDVGKVLSMWNEPQWCVTGDTFVLGCAPPDRIAYRRSTFGLNPDMRDERYNTEYGMYSAHCGLDALLLSWGHDEYMYQVLKNHGQCCIPEAGLRMIRYHSFYPWHTDGEYGHLANEEDKRLHRDVMMLNEHDLYSKKDSVPDVDALKPYYERLVQKYCPGVLSW